MTIAKRRSLGAFTRTGAFCILIATPASAALPDGVTCDSVRAEYARWSWLMRRPAMRAWLRAERNYSSEQIAEAEACLKPIAKSGHRG